MAAGLVDTHVHYAVLGERPEQGFVSPRMLRGAVGFLVRRTLGQDPRDRAALSRAYRERLESQLASSRAVRGAVILALDGVYDGQGRLDWDRTHLYVPNDAVLDAARANPALRAGVSVNPRRRGALDELARVAEAGAALVKWLPNAQQFDPGDPANVPFFRELERRGLPLLVHSGVEFSVVRSTWQAMGRADRWERALDEGVQVIAAHGGSPGSPLGGDHLRVLRSLLDRYPNLWLDSSALGLPNRAGVIRRLRRWGRLDRLTFGTDYPLPCLGLQLLLGLRLGGFRAMLRERNPFDRQVVFLRGLGWEPTSAPLMAVLPAGARKG